MTKYEKYAVLLNCKKRVICGFKENQCGEAIVTTGIPRMFKPGVITYTDQKTTSYENYMLNQTLRKKR